MTAPRITAALDDGAPTGQRVNHRRVVRLMRDARISGYRKRRQVPTTTADREAAPHTDLLNRYFQATALNERYVGDITYPLANAPTCTWPRSSTATAGVWWAGPCATTCAAAWSLKPSKDAQRTRGSLQGAVFHSDHGSVYTSRDFAAACLRLGVTQSVHGRSGLQRG